MLTGLQQTLLLCLIVIPLGLVGVYLRARLAEQGVRTCNDAMAQDDGKYVTVAGMNIRPHRPPTRSGHPVLFTSLEDETDLLLFPPPASELVAARRARADPAHGPPRPGARPR